MALPNNFLELLKSRSDIEEVISRYVGLRKRGKHLVGLCPFHSEKTPSFTVFPDGQNYHCFGCGAGGDAITFVRNIENLDYMDAVRLLAERAGLQMPENEENGSYRRQREKTLAINKSAANYFYKMLLLPANAHAQDYIKKRKLRMETVKTFGVGYAPDSWDSLLRHLQGEGFDKESIKEAGLCVKNKNGGYYDYFRNRVMFPIQDVRGNVIGFGGRVLDDSVPKYLNSPDTVVFKKSLNLFSLNNAKQNDGTLILAEGYMDVIALYQAGFRNAVATLGTAITPDQARLIARYAKEVVIAYDADEAGQKATARAITILGETELKVRVLRLYGSKDPDEFIKTNGSERFGMLLGTSGNHIEYKLANSRAKYNLELPDDKLSFLKEVVDILSSIASPLERDVYASQIAAELGVSKDSILTETGRKRKNEAGRQKQQQIKNEERGLLGIRDPVNPEKAHLLKVAKAEETILCILINHPDLHPKINSEIALVPYATAFNRRVYQAVSGILDEGSTVDTFHLNSMFSTAEMGAISKMMATYAGGQNIETELSDCVAVLKEHHRRERLKNAEEMDTGKLADYISEIGKKKKGADTK